MDAESKAVRDAARARSLARTQGPLGRKEVEKNRQHRLDQLGVGATTKRQPLDRDEDLDAEVSMADDSVILHAHVVVQSLAREAWEVNLRDLPVKVNKRRHARGISDYEVVAPIKRVIALADREDVDGAATEEDDWERVEHDMTSSVVRPTYAQMVKA